MGSFGEDLRLRAKQGFQRRDQMRSLYSNAMKLGAPGRNGWDQTAGVNANPGKEVQRFVYESTFQSSVIRLANALFMGMTPPSSLWIELVPGSNVPEAIQPDVKGKLETPTKIAAQSLWQCQFYSAWLSFLIDFVFGTGFLLCEEGDEFDSSPANFQVLPLWEMGLEPDDKGGIAGIFREHSCLGRNLDRLIPDPEVPQTLKNLAAGNPDAGIKLTSCFVQKEGKWVQAVIWEAEKEPIWTAEFNECPVICARADLLSGEVYGRGPALNASATAYSLNELAKLILIAAQIGVWGMYTTSDETMNVDNIRFRPGGIIKVRANGNMERNLALRPLDVNSRIDWAQLARDDLKSQLQKMLFRDALGNVDGPKMTATEVMERQQLVMQDLGSLGTRLNDEGIGKAVTRFVSVLSRRGRLPAGLKVDGKLVALQYISPFVRAQGREDVNAMRGLMQDAQVAAQTDPAAAVWIDSRLFLQQIALKTGVPMDLLRTEAQAQQVLQQIALAKATMQGAPGTTQNGGPPPDSMAVDQGGPPMGAPPSMPSDMGAGMGA